LILAAAVSARTVSMPAKKPMEWPEPRKPVQYQCSVCNAILIKLHVPEFAPPAPSEKRMEL